MSKWRTVNSAPPKLAVQTMAKICIEVESYLDYGSMYKHITKEAHVLMSPLESLAVSAVKTADTTNCSLILVLVKGCSTMKLVARYIPSVPILFVVVPKIKIKIGTIDWSVSDEDPTRHSFIYIGLVLVLSVGSAMGSYSEATEGQRQNQNCSDTQHHPIQVYLKSHAHYNIDGNKFIHNSAVAIAQKVDEARRRMSSRFYKLKTQRRVKIYELEFTDKYKQANYNILDNSTSLLVISALRPKKSRPFKYNNAWRNMENYKQRLKMAGVSLKQACLKFMCKLKMVKSQLKEWCKGSGLIKQLCCRPREQHHDIYLKLMHNHDDERLITEYKESKEK